MEKNLNGQVALVTGGSKGIGLGVARALMAEGVNVAITGRHADTLAAAERDLSGAGSGRCKAFAVDVRDYDAVTRAVDSIASDFGGLDVVVNNAGVGVFAKVAEMTPQQWADVIGTNLTGVFNVCRASLGALRARGGGYILNISSLAGRNTFIGAAAYCASKAGLNAFGETLMLEVRYDNIKVSTIAPGSVATNFSGMNAGAESDWKIAPGDIGEMVVDLVKMDVRTLPSYIEMRPSRPPRKS